MSDAPGPKEAASFTLTRKTVTVQDLPVDVYRAGSGPTLVWFHGIHGVREDDAVLRMLAATHDVVAPVAPGFNDLEDLKQVRTVHDLALFYDSLFDVLDLAEQLAIAGHSFGAMVAAEYAAHFPRRLKRLVLLSPLGLWNDEYPVEDLFARPYVQIEDFLWRKVGENEPPLDPAAMAALDVEEVVTLARGLTAVTNFTWPIPDKGLSRRLYRIAAPTLIVAGGSDCFVPSRYADDFGAAIARSQVVTIPGASHMVAYERSDDVLKRVEAFLAQP